MQMWLGYMVNISKLEVYHKLHFHVFVWEDTDNIKLYAYSRRISYLFLDIQVTKQIAQCLRINI